MGNRKNKSGEVGYNTSGSISWHHRGVYTEERSIAITSSVYHWATLTEAIIVLLTKTLVE